MGAAEVAELRLRASATPAVVSATRSTPSALSDVCCEGDRTDPKLAHFDYVCEPHFVWAEYERCNPGDDYWSLHSLLTRATRKWALAGDDFMDATAHDWSSRVLWAIVSHHQCCLFIVDR